jgi:hypothetical protein
MQTNQFISFSDLLARPPIVARSANESGEGFISFSQLLAMEPVRYTAVSEEGGEQDFVTCAQLLQR